MSDDAESASAIPEGYQRLDWDRGFGRQIGPLYRRIEGGRARMGFRVGEQHVNGLQNAHGGMLMSFADMAWGQVVSIERSAYWATIRLACDFIASGRIGDWVEGEGERLSGPDDDVFIIRGRVWSGDRLLLTGMGVFKPMQARAPRPGENAYHTNEL